MSRNVRTIASQEITKSLQLISNEPRNVDKDPNTLKLVFYSFFFNLILFFVLYFLYRLKKPIEKPLVIILSWLLGKQKHIVKYVSFFLILSWIWV